MPNIIQNLLESSKQNPRRIVFPETQDLRVIEAARSLHEQKIIVPVLLRREDSQIDDSVSSLETVSLSDDKIAQQCAEQLFENRKHKGLSREAANEAIKDPLLFAALLVKVGFVDGGVAGSSSPTPSVIRAALYGIGASPGRKTISSFFLMQLQNGRALTYADCGVVPDPTAEQLAEIAICAAENHQQLTGEAPKVAMLSFDKRKR